MPRQVFTAGEILTAANMNDLADSTVMVFADSAARGSAIPTPSEGMITYLQDTDEVEKYDGSAFVGVATPPAILQVVSTAKTDTFSASVSAGSTTALTGLSASITPTSATSKILVRIVVNGSTSGVNSSQASVAFIAKRGATAIGVGDAAGSRTRLSGYEFVESGSNRNIVNVFSEFLDSPATTSATTYSVDIGNITGQGTSVTVLVNRTPVDGDNNTNGRAASTITLMEVAG